MALPTKTQISDAVEANENILDPKLSGFNTISGIMGAEMYCGGFCMVYPLINSHGKKYAFRVWHQEIDGIKERIKKIASYLQTLKIPYFVEFEFVENALNVPDAYDANSQIDAIRMDWVAGDNLIEYLNKIITSSQSDSQKKTAIHELAEKFKKMVITLHENHISHGDLQHGNILITPQNELKLVDYDSVYVPTFTDEIQVTSGLAGYQHPCRKGTQAIASEKDDYFSEYIIYASLLAYAEDFSLWEPIDDEDNPRDEYSLLFKETDLQNPTQSALFAKLKNSNNSELKNTVDSLIDVLNQPNCNNLVSIFPDEKYLNQPQDSIILDDDFIESLGESRDKRHKYTAQTIKLDFDEDEARKRYSQN
ncbi:MAG: protein kinase family protein [Muribaculaceae bacterium]|nr:protein kinase family protein [Muribaculaceae bacterium]